MVAGGGGLPAGVHPAAVGFHAGCGGEGEGGSAMRVGDFQVNRPAEKVINPRIITHEISNDLKANILNIYVGHRVYLPMAARQSQARAAYAEKEVVSVPRAVAASTPFYAVVVSTHPREGVIEMVGQ